MPPAHVRPGRWGRGMYVNRDDQEPQSMNKIPTLHSSAAIKDHGHVEVQEFCINRCQSRDLLGMIIKLLLDMNR